MLLFELQLLVFVRGYHEFPSKDVVRQLRMIHEDMAIYAVPDSAIVLPLANDLLLLNHIVVIMAKWAFGNGYLGFLWCSDRLSLQNIVLCKFD